MSLAGDYAVETDRLTRAQGGARRVDHDVARDDDLTATDTSQRIFLLQRRTVRARPARAIA